MRYFGIFQQIKQLNLPFDEHDLYESFYADFYDKIMEEVFYDLDLYKAQAAVTGRNILELACGSGRLTMPLAEAGYSVTGVDLSKDMLSILDSKLKNKANHIRKRVEVINSDMRTFSIDKKFNLAILPITSICLLENNIDVVKMLKSVYDHLIDGGRFVFDIRIFIKSDFPSGLANMTGYTWETGDEKVFVLMQECFYTLEGKAIVNFYGEIIKDDKTFRKLGCTTKRLITEEDVESAVKETKFTIAKTKVIKLSDDEAMKFYILEK
jgi:SAM-dependent methyltransferase